MEIDILSLIQVVGGLVSGIGVGVFTKSGRMKTQADAYKSMAEAYEYRISSLQESEKIKNETIREQNELISSQDHELHDKTKQIRDLTQKLWEAEQRVTAALQGESKAKSAQIRMADQILNLNLELGHEVPWRCIHGDCPERDPKSEEIAGQTYKEFEPPEHNDIGLDN